MSKLAWSAALRAQRIQGQWTVEEKNLHINDKTLGVKIYIRMKSLAHGIQLMVTYIHHYNNHGITCLYCDYHVNKSYSLSRV